MAEGNVDPNMMPCIAIFPIRAVMDHLGRLTTLLPQSSELCLSEHIKEHTGAVDDPQGQLEL